MNVLVVVIDLITTTNDLLSLICLLSLSTTSKFQQPYLQPYLLLSPLHHYFSSTPSPPLSLPLTHSKTGGHRRHRGGTRWQRPRAVRREAVAARRHAGAAAEGNTARGGGTRRRPRAARSGTRRRSAGATARVDLPPLPPFVVAGDSLALLQRGSSGGAHPRGDDDLGRRRHRHPLLTAPPPSSPPRRRGRLCRLERIQRQGWRGRPIRCRRRRQAAGATDPEPATTAGGGGDGSSAGDDGGRHERWIRCRDDSGRRGRWIRRRRVAGAMNPAPCGGGLGFGIFWIFIFFCLLNLFSHAAGISNRMRLGRPHAKRVIFLQTFSHAKMPFARMEKAFFTSVQLRL
uniref:Uncharacterized protein n=1 Tax=Oryza sativa subsp. japonica TaxID=39947 RepID=Q6H4H3_ORYSJ|nr:hypothetical protein [Oryza sativa Japonica Group]